MKVFLLCALAYGAVGIYLGEWIDRWQMKLDVPYGDAPARFSLGTIRAAIFVLYVCFWPRPVYVCLTEWLRARRVKRLAKALLDILEVHYHESETQNPARHQREKRRAGDPE